MADQPSNGELQIVIFELGAEHYGLDIAAVYEIIRHQPVTAVPEAPASVEGVINLRGRIIPVIDLHARFGVGTADVTNSTRIMVVEAAGNRVGLVVDSVSEVLLVPSSGIEEAPAIAAGGAAYLRGIAKVGDTLVTLLDLDLMFGAGSALAA